jgi:hypothetical protein
MNKIKLIELMAVCDEHIIYQSLNALLIWDFLKVIFNEIQCLLSTSVFSYVYFASVTAAFLFYWINVCFGDFI